MPGLLSECETLFGTNNLYDVLGIKKTAKEKEGEGHLGCSNLIIRFLSSTVFVFTRSFDNTAVSNEAQVPINVMLCNSDLVNIFLLHSETRLPPAVAEGSSRSSSGREGKSRSDQEVPGSGQSVLDSE